MADIFDEIQKRTFPTLFGGQYTDNQFIVGKYKVSIFSLGNTPTFDMGAVQTLAGEQQDIADA